MDLLSQKSHFSTEPSTKGFDNTAGDRWIYPENYPIRDYQFNIVKSALYHNTLVCLPTGLGKTFIAAVVMYNFWRWYPKGKIVFLAPTKPLVAQQINACNEIMGIADEETIELTGAMDQKKRQVAWSESSRARVIFATPQVFQNDLEKNIIPTELIKCVVVDEAHRALGKHSYSESIRLLSEKSKYFRVLGLSATPGGKLDAVQAVIRNLHITHLELRDDTSPDITPYINERKLDIVLVGLGADLEKFKDRYITIMDPHVRVLINNNILRGNTSNLSKGRIFMINKEWHQRPNKTQNERHVTKTLTILMTMYHAYDLMIRHGLRAFYHFYQKHEDKFWLSDEHELMKLLEEINYFLGPLPDIRSTIDGNFPVIPPDIRFGHNKFYKLQDILLQHFESYESKEENTRAIVFVEFRDIVNEVYVLLLQSMPLLRPQKFVGQAGQKRREQKKALEDFRSDKVNVLISTSVGEEGLDVGEVDLIVCFDISQVSPIRLVQRMGRTGRKRDGHIIVLVTDGKEHQTLKSSMSRRDSLNNKVLHSSGIIDALYKESPRMVPVEFEPECRKTSVIVQPKIAGTSKSKGKTKEPKKPRKRADNKMKNSKNLDPSGSQSMMKFLKRTRDNIEMEADNDIVALTVNEIHTTTSHASQQSHTSNNTVKLSNIKLLTCDDAAVEFLTLCTMKKSQNYRTNVDESEKNPYFPSYYEEPEILDFNFDIPDLQILDCLKTLEPYVEITKINENEEDSIICEENHRFWPTQRFNDSHVCHDFQQNEAINNFADSRFEAMLDDSSDDIESTSGFHPTVMEKNDLPIDEKVDWSKNIDDFGFEDFVDEWSDETRMSDGKNQWNVKDESNDGNQSKIAKDDDAMINSTMKFGAFEDLLNDESRTSDEKNEKVESNDGEKSKISNNDAMENSTIKLGIFENLLNDESSTRSSYEPKQSNVNHDCEEKAETEATNDVVMKNSPMKLVNFENLLNDDSTTSSEKKRLDTAQDKLTENIANETGAFEDLLNDDWETSSEKSESETKIDGLTKFSAFEDLLNDDSTTKSEKNDSHEKTLIVMENNEAEKEKLCEKIVAFEDILNSSSSDSETQFNIELIPKKENDQSFSRKFMKTTFDNEFSNKIQAHDVINEKFVTNNESMDTLIQAPNETNVSDKSIEIINDDDSVDLLKDYVKEISQISNNEKRHFKIISDIEENSKNSSTMNNSTPKNLKQLTSGMITLAQALETMEQTSKETKIERNEFVNNDEDLEISCLQTRPVSLALVDVNSDSWHSRFDTNTSSRETLCLRNVNVEEEIMESDDDIFAIDDLMVDSDFEKEINIIEKSAEKSEITRENGENCVSIVKDTSEKIDDLDIIRLTQEAEKIVDSTVEQSTENLVEKLSKTGDSSAAKSFRLELNLNNWKNKRLNLDSRDIKEKNLTNNEETNLKLSPTKSLRLEINRESPDWNSDVFRVRQTINDKSSLNENKNLDKSNKTSTNSSSLRAKVSDFNLDDFDWDSSDFETLIPTSRASTSNVNIVESTKTSSSNDQRKENSEKFVKTSGWLSTKKPKSCLSLSKKLSSNIFNDPSGKRTSDKSFVAERDSDLENDFTVSRLETEISKDTLSPYFAKPKPISTMRRNKVTSTMNNIGTRGKPLSMRSNDVNKIDLTDLKKFSATERYEKPKRETSNERLVGVGRQKSASCDLDTRKRKRRMRQDKECKRARARNEFIDDEAEVSSDYDDGRSDSSGNSDDDLDNFVSYTQNVDDDHVDMQAHYLQTVRSPRRPGGFYIRKPKSPCANLQIYSQPVGNEPNSYMHDSFCVDENEDIFEDSVSSDEITRLEELELRRRSKKRKRAESKETRIKRKRKVLIPTPDATSSSEDETEKLRRQIQEESYILKNKSE